MMFTSIPFRDPLYLKRKIYRRMLQIISTWQTSCARYEGRVCRALSGSRLHRSCVASELVSDVELVLWAVPYNVAGKLRTLRRRRRCLRSVGACLQRCSARTWQTSCHPTWQTSCPATKAKISCSVAALSASKTGGLRTLLCEPCLNVAVCLF